MSFVLKHHRLQQRKGNCCEPNLVNTLNEFLNNFYDSRPTTGKSTRASSTKKSIVISRPSTTTTEEPEEYEEVSTTNFFHSRDFIYYYDISIIL